MVLLYKLETIEEESLDKPMYNGYFLTRHELELFLTDEFRYF